MAKSSPRHALIVTKDIASLNTAPALRTELESRGFRVTVIAEGLSMKGWCDRGVPLHIVGSVDFKQTPDRIESAQIHKIFADLRPDMLIVSTGSPNNLESKFAITAKGKGVPVAVLEDFPGATGRLVDVKPDLIMVIDEYARALAAERYPGATLKIIGNMSVKTEIKISADEIAFIAQARQNFGGGPVVAFVGGSTFDDLELLLKCEWEEESFSKGGIVPLFHPKTVNTLVPGSNMTKGEKWRQMLAKATGVSSLFPPEGISSEAIVALADVVCSGFSNMMVTAAGYGKPVGALGTPEVMESLQLQSGLTEIPWVELGIARLVSIDDPMCPPAMWEIPPLSMERRKELLKPYEPTLAADAIEALLH